MSEQLTKEAQVQASVNALIILIVGVGIGALMLIFVGVLGGNVFNQSEADIDAIYAQVSNENIGTANATGGLIATINTANLPLTSITSVTCNASTVPSANYSFVSDTGVVTVTHLSECNLATVNVTYFHGNHTIETSIREGITSGFDALDTTSGYMPLVVLAVIISLVMAMVLGMGGTGRKSGGSYEYSL